MATEPTKAHLLAQALRALRQAGSPSAETVRRELLDLTRPVTGRKSA